MLVKGDIKCLHCGHISGQWVGKGGTALTPSGYRPRQERDEDPEASIKCARCHGPVFLDDAAAVMNSHRLRRIRRMRAQIAAFAAHGRDRAA